MKYNQIMASNTAHSEHEDYLLALQLQQEFNEGSADEIIENSSGSSNIARPVSLVEKTWELIDPTPDIRALFLEYNDRFFSGKLAGVEVKWSPRMTLCAGVCSYEGRGGLCSIRLSVPLLKLRPRKDLVETLLHEMIHAYLFVTNNDRDRDGHGPNFQFHMHRINEEAGTKISIYHSFHDEVENYRQHWWQCDGPCKNRKPYFGLVKRAMNRAPSKNDFWFADHQRTCGGTYHKIKEPENTKAAKDKKTPAKGPIPDKGQQSMDNFTWKVDKSPQKQDSTGADEETRAAAFAGKGYTLGTQSSAVPGTKPQGAIVRVIPGIGVISNGRTATSSTPGTSTQHSVVPETQVPDDESDDIVVYSPISKAVKQPSKEPARISLSDLAKALGKSSGNNVNQPESEVPHGEHTKMKANTSVGKVADCMSPGKNSPVNCNGNFVQTIGFKYKADNVKPVSDKFSGILLSDEDQELDEMIDAAIEKRKAKIEAKKRSNARGKAKRPAAAAGLSVKPGESMAFNRNKRALELGSSSDEDLEEKEKSSLASLIKRKKTQVLESDDDDVMVMDPAAKSPWLSATERDEGNKITNNVSSTSGINSSKNNALQKSLFPSVSSSSSKNSEPGQAVRKPATVSSFVFKHTTSSSTTTSQGAKKSPTSIISRHSTDAQKTSSDRIELSSLLSKPSTSGVATVFPRQNPSAANNSRPISSTVTGAKSASAAANNSVISRPSSSTATGASSTFTGAASTANNSIISRPSSSTVPDAAASAAIHSTNYVNCPVCSTRVQASLINQHLDQCL